MAAVDKDYSKKFRVTSIPEPAPEAADAAIFGGAAPVNLGIGERITVKPMPIMSIVPDLTQPRRALPSAAAAAWDRTAAGARAALESWWVAARNEWGRDLPLVELITGEVEIEIDDTVSAPITAAFLAMAGLAASIRRDGLTNPITVVAVGAAHRIETGERRWWAYQLLHAVDVNNAAKWEKIPARTVESFSRWRQATENNQREQLNAISRARQLAILLMDLHGWEHFATFDQMVTGGGACDRAFYAQVADGELWRVPRGRGQQLVEAMGLQNAQQIRQYRALLRLPDAIWMRADDESWAEQRIRSAADTVSTDTVSVDPPPPPPKSPDEIALPTGKSLAVGQGGALSQIGLWDKATLGALTRARKYTPADLTTDRARAQALADAERLEGAAAALRKLARGS